MKRRELLRLAGGAIAAWPVAASAQQATMPVVGFLNAASAQSYTPQAAAFLKGLGEAGYVDGRDVAVEYRWADGQNERLPALAADLVHRPVTVIAATTTPAAVAARAATTTIPIVFEMGNDPVRLGLVASLSRPGGNVTGVTTLNVEVAPKRLEILHELVPTATVIAVLIDPTDPVNAEETTRQMRAAAPRLGIDLHVLAAGTERELDAAFTKLAELRAGGLVLGGGPFFLAHQEKLASLTVRYGIPTVFDDRPFVAAGGLISYGGSFSDAYRLAGVYTGRILKGQKPGELPVLQATRVELRINLKTAKALGVTVPLPLAGRADELIE
jgi:ABC-type uncharacterized transport system substrate-binding protein